MLGHQLKHVVVEIGPSIMLFYMITISDDKVTFLTLICLVAKVMYSQAFMNHESVRSCILFLEFIYKFPKVNSLFILDYEDDARMLYQLSYRL